MKDDGGYKECLSEETNEEQKDAIFWSWNKTETTLLKSDWKRPASKDSDIRI